MRLLFCCPAALRRCVLAFMWLSLALPVLVRAEDSLDRVPGQFLIQYSPAVHGTARQRIIERRLGVRALYEHRITGATLIQESDGARFDDAYAKQLLASGTVRSLEPNWIVRSSALPSDPQLSQLWGLQNTGQTGGSPDADIDAPEAWGLTTGSDQIVVGVIDTGIDATHPDLAPNIWHNPRETVNGVDDDGNGYVDDVSGVNFIRADLPPNDDNGHGTHVAGTIGAVGNNALGVVGVNWKVRILPLKFLDASGSGTTDSAIRAIEYAVLMRRAGVPLRVLSNSWGGGGYSQALDDAIQAAERENILFVAAAGNASTDNDSVPSYPANYIHTNTVSVAAIDSDGNLAPFSNFGLTTVDLAAPGVNILSTAPGGTYRSLSGTSMATPHVSGVAALLFAREPNLSAADAKVRIIQTAKLLPGLNGTMRVPGTADAYRALTNQRSSIPGVPATMRYRQSPHPLLYDPELGERVLQVDDGYSEQTLPAPLLFYGTRYSRIAVSANGRIIPLAEGQNAPTAGDYSNALRPGINVFHDDLFPAPEAIAHGQGGVWMKREGSHTTVTWVAVPYAFRGSTDATKELRFQAELFSSGRIDFRYLDTSTGDAAYDAGASATVGISPFGAGERLLVNDNAANPDELADGRAITLRPLSLHVENDIDGDGVSDILVWRPDSGMWFILTSSTSFAYERHLEIQHGLPGDNPLTGDFDGDGRTDLAVWRPANGTWYLRLSSASYSASVPIQWGIRGDRPLTGDVDGDGTSDLVVYRSSDGFYVLRSSTGFQRDSTLQSGSLAQTRIAAGGAGNDPLLGDFDGDGKKELTTVWQLLRFWTARNESGTPLFSLPWGERGDTPLSCDWDGNAIDDRIQVRVSSSYELNWFAVTDSGAVYEARFGSILDMPKCSSDFDGDGTPDLAVFRPYTGEWYVRLSFTQELLRLQFGLPGDIPL